MNLLAELTGPENTELFVRLNRAGQALNRMTGLLIRVDCPQKVWEQYIGTWDDVHHLMGDLNAARPEGAPPVFVPSGTGWPVA